jgi:hypothetical protein
VVRARRLAIRRARAHDRPMRAILAAASFAVAALLSSGQSRPDGTPQSRGALEPLRALMAKLREHPADVATARALAAGLIESGHAMAASWWVATTEEAAGRDLPAPERDALAALGRAADPPAGYPEERKLAQRLVRQSESLIADKDIARATQSAALARCLLRFFADANIGRGLDGVAKRLAAKPAAAGTSRLPPEFEAEGHEACARLIGTALDEYEAAGCPAGRRVIGRALADAAGFAAPERLVTWRQQLRAHAKTVEPGLGLKVFLRTSHGVRVATDGKPIEIVPGAVAIDGPTQAPFVVPGLPGDRVTFLMEDSYAANPGTGQVFLVGLSARWDGKDVAASRIFCSLSEDPSKAGADLKPAPLARAFKNPPASMFGKQGAEYDDALRASKAWFSVPSGANVPWYPDIVGWQAEFDAAKLKPVWFGDEMPEGAHFALVVAIPEE